MPTPSFEKLLMPKGGGGSGQPPPMPLAAESNRKGNNSMNNKSSGKVVANDNKRGSKSREPSQSTSTPRMKQTDDAVGAAVGLCGGTAALAAVGRCEVGLGRGSSSSFVGSATLCDDSHDDGLSAAEASIQLEPYSVHHDEIVTALIDEALRNSAGADTSPTARTVEQRDIETRQERGELNNSDSSKPAGKKPRSPYRMKRNSNNQVCSPVAVSKLRKRPRSSDDKKSSPASTPPKPKSSALNSRVSSTKTNNITTKTVNPADFFHPECILQKEKGADNKHKSKLGFGMTSNKSNNNNDENQAPSAIGREQTLIKLQKKLSMLGDIESGKFGKAAEMLRSDAVAFAIQGDDNDGVSASDHQGHKRSGSHGHNRSGSYGSKLMAIKPVVTKVETRSILTLKMGFVSMSYGILLQWDCASRLVELIVLRKMCRDDFLKRKGNDPSARDRPSLTSRSKRDVPPARPPLPPKKPELIPVPVINRSSHSEGELNLIPPDPPDLPRNSHHRSSLSKLSSPLASFSKFLSGSRKPQYFLSVSVLNVTQLHGICDHCRNPNSVGRMSNGARLGSLSRRKRGHPTLRPYIRFVLGKHEHCTKITKFNNGNPTWSKRHHNSCSLPCPPEELRWFAGREDLIVEVRNNWKIHGSGGSGVKAGSRQHHRPLFGGKNDADTSSNNDDPILATVTVPLSSVNIEDENGTKVSPDHDAAAGDGIWKRRTTKDGASSTNITIPLRMNCCQSAPIGSISLKITIKVPSRDGMASSSIPSALAKPNIQVGISVSGGSWNGEPKVNESIELGPLTRLMDGWSLSGSARDSASKENNSKESVAAATAVPNYRKPTTQRSQQKSTRNSNKGGKKRKQFRWSKQLDHQTKKWSNLESSPTSNAARPPIIESSKKDEGSASNDNDGWFAFLNR